VHEAAITAALVEQVRSFLPEGGRLIEVHVEVGEMEHLDSGVMEMLWSVSIEDTELSGATLTVYPVLLLVRCEACQDDWLPEDPAMLVCPGCGAARPKILEGSGVLLRSLEVEEQNGG
jgi:hydrogenase nickel incorporation protein HypA/HybF